MPEQDFLNTNLGVADEFQKYNAAKDQMPPIEISSTNKGGSLLHTLTMDDQTLQGILQKMQYTEQAMQSMTQEVNRLQQREQQVRQHPILNALAQVGGQLAVSDKRLPPLVAALGRSSLALNPTPDQLGQQRLGLQQEIGKMGESQARLSETMLQHQMLRFDRQQTREDKAKQEQAKIDATNTTRALQEARLIAQKGGGPMNEVAFVGIMKAHKVLDPEQIASAYAAHLNEAELVTKGLDAAAVRKAQGQTFKEQLDEKLAGVKGQISLGNRLTAIRQSFMNSVSPTKADFEVKLHEAKKAIDEAAASSKEFRVLGPQIGNQLKQANQTNGYLDTVEHMLEQPEFKEVQGPLFQFNPQTGEVKLNAQAALPKQFKNIDRTVVESQISHEIPRLLGLLLNGQAGGASILRTDVGKKLVQDMGITGAIRPDQALAILKIIRDTNNNNVAAAMRLKPQANFAAIKDLLSADDPRNAYFFKGKKDSFGGPLQPFPDPNRGGGSSTSAPQKQGLTGLKPNFRYRIDGKEVRTDADGNVIEE